VAVGLLAAPTVPLLPATVVMPPAVAMLLLVPAGWLVWHTE
jgi:hypothetical protein